MATKIPDFNNVLKELHKIKDFCNTRTFEQCCKTHECPYNDAENNYTCKFTSMGLGMPFEWSLYSMKGEANGNES